MMLRGGTVAHLVTLTLALVIGAVSVGSLYLPLGDAVPIVDWGDDQTRELRADALPAVWLWGSLAVFSGFLLRVCGGRWPATAAIVAAVALIAAAQANYWWAYVALLAVGVLLLAAFVLAIGSAVDDRREGTRPAPPD